MIQRIKPFVPMVILLQVSLEKLHVDQITSLIRRKRGHNSKKTAKRKFV